jgi:hypothetical protein
MKFAVRLLATFLSSTVAMADEPKLPPNVLAEIRAIIAKLSDDDRMYIRDLPKDDLIMLHRGFGAGLRNSFRQNEYPSLLRYCDDNLGSEPRSSDAYSGIAIPLIWQELQAKPDQGKS